MVNDILAPMNHREIEYNAKKLSGCDIPDSFLCTWVSKENMSAKLTDIRHMSGEDKTSLLDCTDLCGGSNPLDYVDLYTANFRENRTALLKWLDEIGGRVFDEDLVMDYGTDCLRLYLLFEQTPKEKDAPYYNSWQEGALEGIYKFLGRYRRMILVADAWNRSGNYSETMLSTESICRLKEALENTDLKIKKCIERGNTMSNRHKIVSALMELLNVYQKELKIGEIVTRLHTHAVEMAVPYGSLEHNFELEQKEEQVQNPEVTELCQKFIAIIAPYAPSLSVVLWSSIVLQFTPTPDSVLI